MKRVHKSDDGDDHEHSKRSRRSRWDHDSVNDKEAIRTETDKTVASPKALNDIVKRLSSVVQEKSSPEELEALTKGAVSRPLIVSTKFLIDYNI